VTDKKAFGYKARVANDMSNLYLNPDSVLHCDHCKNRLGVLHTLRYALFKKPGTHYFVICKDCKHPNERIKGYYKQQMEQQWKDLEEQVREQRKQP
jgi:RNase P subunit RPR2